MIKYGYIQIFIGITLFCFSILIHDNGNINDINQEELTQFIIDKNIPSDNITNVSEEIEKLYLNGGIINYINPIYYFFIFIVVFSLFFLFVGIHNIVDKFFFKKFYENPSIYNSYRRGLYLIFCVLLYFYNRLIPQSFEFNFGVITLLFLIEILLISFKFKRS